MNDAQPAPSEAAEIDELRAQLAASEHRNVNLQAALANSRVIGAATGILIERFRLDQQRAFDHLVAVSQSTNEKVSEVAEQLVYSGTVPEVRARRTDAPIDPVVIPPLPAAADAGAKPLTADTTD